ncbi:hypothetical protein [Nocardioides sp. YIM 152588]|uniref:hypothetical protein n=1 Tax=Nocardioides sp. YIM 152588 TaxID=3158259 RepID=UPI0032E4394A
MRQAGGHEGRRRSVAPATTAGSDGIPADLMLGPGGRYAGWALWLRLYRAGTLVLITFGVAVAVAVGRAADLEAEQLDSAEDLVGAVVSPLALFAVGLILRLLLGPVVLVLVLVAASRSGYDIQPGEDRRSRRARAFDRFRLASAGRSLLWTSAVKDEAVAHLGGRGRRLAVAEVVLRILAVVGLVAIVPASVIGS